MQQRARSRVRTFIMRLPVVITLVLLGPRSVAPIDQSAATAALAAPLAPPSLHKTLLNSVLPVVSSKRATLVRAYNPQQMLRFAISLEPQDPAGEQQFLQELQNKASPLFHQYLTADQWNARFGPLAQSEQAVVDWAQSQGLTVTHRYADRLLVDLAAPVSTIEQGLSVSINTYKLGETEFYANDRAPAIPQTLSGSVHAVLGLNDYEVAQPSAGSSHSGFPLQTRTGDRGSIEPVAVPRAIDSRGLGRADAEGEERGRPHRWFLRPDRSVQLAGLRLGCPGCPWSLLQPGNNGGILRLNRPSPSPPPAPLPGPTCRGSSRATAPWPTTSRPSTSTARQVAATWRRPSTSSGPSRWPTASAPRCPPPAIYVYEGADGKSSTFTDIYNFMLSDGHARSFSTSWCCTELTCTASGTMDTDHNIFDAMIGQGWTLTAATGDHGAYDDCTQ